MEARSQRNRNQGKDHRRRGLPYADLNLAAAGLGCIAHGGGHNGIAIQGPNSVGFDLDPWWDEP